MLSLAASLDAHARQSDLCEHLDDARVRCLACAHRCLLRPGQRGVCKVRFNRDGHLLVPHGYVSALNVDPVEKKPFYHVLPGSKALTFGTLGCNLRCDFCQNWDISQTLRDDEARGRIAEVSPEGIVEAAARSGSRLVVSSYNEPLVAVEWAAAVFGLARAHGLMTAIVSNGYATPEVLDYLRPVLDCVKVDLKATSEPAYRRLGGRLQPVLDTIRRAVDLGYWVEVVTLVVPGLNDAPDDLRAAAEYLASVSADLPWHVTAFHPDYRLLATPRTTTSALLRAVEVGRAAGLRFVYAGNRPDLPVDAESTRCPACGALLVERRGFRVSGGGIASGRCSSCGAAIPGVWG